MSYVTEKLEAMKERAEELEIVHDKLLDILHYIEELEYILPEGIYGSHHAEMEYSDTLSQVEEELQELKDKVSQ